MDNILVPVDGSDYSKKAVLAAKRLAQKFDSKVVLVNVVPDMLAVNTDNEVDLISENIKAGEELLKEIKEEFDLPKEKVTTRCLVGDVAKEILDTAKREDTSLIVMGSRGLGAISRTLLGSVSYKVLNHSDISVLIAK